MTEFEIKEDSVIHNVDNDVVFSLSWHCNDLLGYTFVAESLQFFSDIEIDSFNRSKEFLIANHPECLL